MPRDLTRTGVIERKVENFNPFKGKFTFKTAYGPPPTASLSGSQATASVVFDLGVTELGPTFTVNNMTTGSLHSSSFFSCARALSINDTVVGIGEFFVTTQSILDIRVGINGTETINCNRRSHSSYDNVPAGFHEQCFTVMEIAP